MMHACDYWQVFLETGAPEAYLCYIRMQKKEDAHVSDHPGHCPESHGLQ